MPANPTLAVIDCETTGLDIQADRIIELAILVWDGAEITASSSKRFNPGFPIPPEATAIHGITDADVANCPQFDAPVARSILARLKGSDLVGYNLRRLDLPILDEELRRVGYQLDLTGVRVLDVFGIFSKKEPRALGDAVRKYCGREHDGAHGAIIDARATLDVMWGQMRAYPDLAAMSFEELAKYSTLGDYAPADLAGKLGFDSEGFLVYAFGKQRGIRVCDDPGFGEWMCNRDFPASTKEMLRVEFERLDGVEEARA